MGFEDITESVIDVSDDVTIAEYKGMLSVRANSAAGSFTITLPASAVGRAVEITKVSSDANQITIAFSGSDSANGQTTIATLTFIGDSYFFVGRTSGSNWGVGNPSLTIP